MNEEQSQPSVQEPKRNTKPLIITLVVLLLIALTGYAVYAWQQSKITKLDKEVKELQQEAKNTKESSDTPEVSTASTESTEEKTTLIITDSLKPSAKVTASLVVANGWTAKEGGTPQLSKAINGVNYRIDYQITDTDYIATPYGGKGTLIKTIKLGDGTTAYIVKSDDYVFLSSCMPTADKSCSFKVNGSIVLVFMHGYQAGDQYVRELQFGTAATNTAIAEFETMAKTLTLK